jgi:hypothetical protein
VKFGPSGEQAVPRILFVQYQGIAGNDIEQFNQPGKQVIVSRPAFVSGKFLYPYADPGQRARDLRDITELIRAAARFGSRFGIGSARENRRRNPAPMRSFVGMAKHGVCSSRPQQ